MSGKNRSPHSLSQWVQINETSVLKHMCLLSPNLLSPTLSGHKLNTMKLLDCLKDSILAIVPLIRYRVIASWQIDNHATTFIYKKSCAGDNISCANIQLVAPNAILLVAGLLRWTLLTCQCLHMYHLYTGMLGMQYQFTRFFGKWHQCT